MNKIILFFLHENVWLWRRRPTVRDLWFNRCWRLRRTQCRLTFVVAWIDGKFFQRFRNGNSFVMQNWAESRWYIRIHYCPLLFLRDASRNRWQHTEVAVNCLITWLPPNHTYSKWHHMSFDIQPLRKICCTFMAVYVQGPRFVLVADLASEIQYTL